MCIHTHIYEIFQQSYERSIDQPKSQPQQADSEKSSRKVVAINQQVEERSIIKIYARDGKFYKNVSLSMSFQFTLFCLKFEVFW